MCSKFELIVPINRHNQWLGLVLEHVRSVRPYRVANFCCKSRAAFRLLVRVIINSIIFNLLTEMPPQNVPFCGFVTKKQNLMAQITSNLNEMLIVQNCYK